MSQKLQVLNHLRGGKSITPIEALNKFGCFRLADVIYKLRGSGHTITTTIERVGKTSYARYTLVKSGGAK